MRNLLRISVAVFLCAAIHHAGAEVIGFTGGYAPGTWTTTTTGSVVGGSVTITNDTLTLVGSDSLSGCIGGTFGVIGPCEVRVTTTLIDNPFSFHWTYSTADIGGPAADIFGVIVNGVRTALSDAGGTSSQSGDFLVNAVSSFGWFINCTDCIRGSATARITDFRAGSTVTSLPEPGSLALFGAMLVGIGATARLKKRIYGPLQ
jgi:hypothetical protein